MSNFPKSRLLSWLGPIENPWENEHNLVELFRQFCVEEDLIDSDQEILQQFYRCWKDGYITRAAGEGSY